MPAALETVAVAVHLQDVDLVGEAVQQSAGEPLGAEHVGPLVEGQVGGDQDGAPLVALAEDLEEEFRPGGGPGDEAQLVDDQQPEAGQLPLEVEQAPFVPGLHEFVDQGRGGGEAYGHSLLAGGQAQPQGHVGLAGATVADGDDILPMLDVFTPGQFHDQGLVHRGYGQEVEGVQAFDRGEAGGANAALHHALVSVDEFQFGQTQQVVRVVHILGGALGGQLAVFPQEGGQPQFLQVVFQEQRGPVAPAALPDRRAM